MDFKNRRLLMILHSYANFTKDQIECIAPHFGYVDVLVRYAPIAEISNFIPINALKPFRRAAKIDVRDLPSNIRVTLVPLWYLPTDAGRKALGEKHFQAIDRLITRYNIEFDVVHAHFAWSAGYVGARLKEKYGVPLVVTAHRYDVTELPFKDEDWRCKIRYVLNTADYIISVSNSNIDYIKRLDVYAPWVVIPNGFRDRLFYPQDTLECRKSLGLPPEAKIILNVASLIPRKGHQYLVSAMQLVTERRGDVICIIVGDGPLKRKLEKQIVRSGLSSHIKLLDIKPHHELVTWMNACDLFVLPSLEESFGVVQVEAMACGKPVVATYNGGSEEVIVSEDVGYLVEPANPGLLADRILAALDRSWDAAAINKFAQQFRWEDITKRIMGVYQTVLK